MAADDDLNATQWVAVVAVLLMLLVPLAVALAAWFKRRYARAIVQLQASTAGAVLADAADPTAPSSGSPPAPLTIDLRTALSWSAADGPDPTQPARRLRRKVLALQFTSGLLYWWALLLCLVVALAFLAQVTGEDLDGDGGGATLGGHLVLWPLLVLPAALAWAIQAGLRESRVWAVAGVTMALFGLGIVDVGAGWAAGAALAGSSVMLTLMMVAFMRPAVRGAGPPLVAALTVGWLVFCALVALIVVLSGDDDTPTTATDFALAGVAVLVLLALSGAAAWRVLLRLARRYEARRFSELQLALGAYWALITLFTLGAVLFISFESRTQAAMEWVALAILLLWWLWRWAQRGALWLARRRAPAPLGAMLMLRVFKPSGRSEAFTDRFLARWRFAAPVWMIAGPDLAGAYMEPDEFFAYLRRDLARRFITTAADVTARVDALDAQRDPDGRLRVAELFCANTTWKLAVHALIDRAGVVLLDLREYSAQRAGTRYELEELLRRDALAKLIVVADERDDLAALQAQIQSLWREVASPGRRGTMRLITLGAGSDAEMHGLFRAAAAAAAASPR